MSHESKSATTPQQTQQVSQPFDSGFINQSPNTNTPDLHDINTPVVPDRQIPETLPGDIENNSDIPDLRSAETDIVTEDNRDNPDQLTTNTSPQTDDTRLSDRPTDSPVDLRTSQRRQNTGGTPRRSTRIRLSLGIDLTNKLSNLDETTQDRHRQDIINNLDNPDSDLIYSEMSVQGMTENIAITKFSGMDMTQRPEDFLRKIQQKINFSIGPDPIIANPPPTTGVDNRNQQIKDSITAYHSRRMGLLSSCLEGNADKWYAALPAETKNEWTTFQTEFINQFNTKQYRFQAQLKAKSLKRNPKEPVRHFAMRVEQVVLIGWAGETEDTIRCKKKEIFTNGLLPKSLKSSAFNEQIKNPNLSWDNLLSHVDDKDISLALTDDTLEPIPDEYYTRGSDINHITEQFDEMHINVINKNQRFRPNGQKFCKFCRRNGHSIANCFKKNGQSNRGRGSQTFPRRFNGQPNFSNYRPNRPDNYQDRFAQNPRPYNSDFRKPFIQRNNFRGNFRGRGFSRGNFNRRGNYQNNPQRPFQRPVNNVQVENSTEENSLN